MSFVQYFDDDRSSSFDLSSTAIETPEGSIPTTTTSTEAVSCCERLKLQKGPWVSYFHKNTIRFILAGLFLLIQLSSYTCRLVFNFLYYRVVFSIVSTISGIISFMILWAFIPESPPYFASKGGIPLYKQKKDGDVIDPYGKWKKSAGQAKLSWFQRLLLQKEPWMLHLKNYTLECAMASVLFAVFLTLAAFRLFTRVDDPPTFSIAAAFSFVLSFASAWLLIPDAPPFLATPDGLPVFKAVPTKSVRQSFKDV